MPPSTPNPGSAAILAILLEAEQAGVGKLLRTTLMKYLYLLDVYMAEESQGQTWCGVTWGFHHFGPYSTALADEIDRLAELSLIQAVSGGGTTKDYFLYTVGEWSTAKTFETLGFPSNVRIKLLNAIREFRNSLSALLDTVYFRTEPMANARPGDDLDFSECRRLSFASIKPLQMKSIDSKASVLLLKKLEERAAAKKQAISKIIWEGPYDDVYSQGIAELNGEPLEAGLSGRATIAVQ